MQPRAGFDRRAIAFFAVAALVLGVASGEVRTVLSIAAAAAILFIVFTVWRTVMLDDDARRFVMSKSKRYQAAKLQAEQRSAAESGRGRRVANDILDEPS